MTLVCFAFSDGATSYAQERSEAKTSEEKTNDITTENKVSAPSHPNEKLKSEDTARVLAFSPIPGDALLYGGEPLAAAGTFAWGGLSLLGFFAARSELNAGCFENGQEIPCDDPLGLDGFFRGLAIVSILSYLGAVVYDGIGGMEAVREHNIRVKALQKRVRLSPLLLPSDGRLVVGLQGQF